MQTYSSDHKLTAGMIAKSEPEDYFAGFRPNIIGQQQTFESPFGEKEIIYADWTASGRAYQPIEECIQNDLKIVYPYQLGNNVFLSQRGFPCTEFGCKMILPETPMLNTVSI